MSDFTAVNTNFKIEPKRFALWISMVSMTMAFVAFTSAYVVRQGAGNWLEYSMPNVFYISTIVIIISSLTLHLSFKGYINNKENQYKLMLAITAILGIAFVFLQLKAWGMMFEEGIELKGNPSGSFMYVITGIHALHVMGGIAALFIALTHALTLKYKITEKRRNRFTLVTHYWHFVGVVWVYLFLFLLFTK